MMLKTIHKKRGHAIVEFSMMFIVFAILFAFLYGSWGVLHAGILNSISARFYAFDRIANRADLSMDVIENGTEIRSYFNENKKDIRYFAVIYDERDVDQEFVSQRLKMDSIGPAKTRSSIDEKELIVESPTEWAAGQSKRLDLDKRRFKGSGVKAVYLKQGYGICLDAACGQP